jgi:hypothetical protein
VADTLWESEAAIENSNSPPASESRRERVLWFVLIVVLIVSRAPNLLIDPRFWFYEAMTYFEHARQNGVLSSLLFISTHQPSYLNLSVNIPATVAAHLIPLRSAPVVTTIWAFLVQLVPFTLVLFGTSRIWIKRHHRLIVCSILLFGPPVISGEVWLNSGNSQVFCGIVGLLLLCEDTRNSSRQRKWLYLGLLTFCAFSGPYTVFLAPAFVFKAVLDGAPESRRHAWIVVWAALGQATIHLLTRYAYPFAPSRFAANHWGVRLSILFVNDILYSLFGYDLSPIVARGLGLQQVASQAASSLEFKRLAGWSSLVGFVAVISFLVYRPRRRFELLLPMAFALFIGPLFFLTPEADNRYVVVPGTALLLALFSAAIDEDFEWRRPVSAIMVALSIGAGVAAYWRDLPREYSPLGRAPRRPSWSEEVKRWKEDSGYRLRIWPYPRRVAIRTPLLPETGPEPPSAYLTVQPFSLIAKGGQVTRFLPVSGLPADFRLIIKMRSTQPADKTNLKLVLEDGFERRLNTHPISGFGWHQDYWIDLRAEQIPLRIGARFSHVRKIRIVLDSKAEMPHRVKFERFSIEPANIGALDPVLPSRPLHSKEYEFENSVRATLVAESASKEEN